MKRRLTGLFLVFAMCIILGGCGKSSIPTESISKDALSQVNCVPINESKTLYYYLEDYRVVVLNNYYTRFGQNQVNLDSLVVDGNIVYYDVTNDCFTMQPPLAN